MPRKWRDLASRAAWTAAQAALGVVTAAALGVPVQWAAVFATLLSMAKSFVATKVGNPATVTFVDTPELDPADDLREPPSSPQPTSSTELRGRAAGGSEGRPQSHRREVDKPNPLWDRGAN